MPWTIHKDSRCGKSKPWGVVKTSNNELEGCHRSKKAASRQIAALNASEVKESMNQLTESFSTDIQILESKSDNANVVGRARFAISDIEKRNRNGRVYPGSIWEKQVSRFNRGSVTGQDGHPMLFETPKITETFLIFDKLEVMGDEVFGEADIVNTERGRSFMAVSDAGAKIACSTRGVGSVKQVKEWTDGKPASVVQDDFKLLGVDVMFDGYQSVPTAKLKDVRAESLGVSFLHEEIGDYIMSDITQEFLAENHPEVVKELTKELKNQIKELKEDAKALSASHEDLVSQSETAQRSLEEATTSLQSLTEERDQLTEERDALAARIVELESSVATLNDQERHLHSLAEARRYLFDKIVGERAGMQIAQRLIDISSIEDIDDAYDQAKEEAERALANMPGVSPRSMYVNNNKDDSDDSNLVSPDARAYRSLTGI